MPRVVHFEIHADDPRRAMEFYSAIFGWQFTQFGTQEYWLIKTGEDSEMGINGGLLKGMGKKTGGDFTAFVCTVGVERIEEAIERVVQHKGSVTAPLRAVPNMGWLAYCKDTEGNIFGLFQPDPSAI